jgi:hypothetical protein
MNKHLTIPLLILGFSGILLTSCTKDPSVEQPKGPQVKNEIIYDKNRSTKDSVYYIYAGTKVFQTNIKGDQNVRFLFDYNGNQIVRKNYYQGSSTVSTECDKIVYYPDGKVLTIEHFTINNSIETATSIINFYYSGGKVSRLVFSQFINGVAQMTSQRDFAYINDNVSSETITDADNPDHPYTITFTYDSQENYCKNLFSQPALIDPALELSDVFNAPMLFSKNNPKTMSTSGIVSPVQISYGFNNHKNLTGAFRNGSPVVRYDY